MRMAAAHRPVLQHCISPGKYCMHAISFVMLNSDSFTRQISHIVLANVPFLHIRQVVVAKINEAKLNEVREWYRPVAARCSLMFFLVMSLQKIHCYYQFALSMLVAIFERAIREAAWQPPPQSHNGSTVAAMEQLSFTDGSSTRGSELDLLDHAHLEGGESNVDDLRYAPLLGGAADLWLSNRWYTTCGAMLCVYLTD